MLPWPLVNFRISFPMPVGIFLVLLFFLSHNLDEKCVSCLLYLPPPFGRQMRREFLFDSNFINLNHASGGSYPRHVQTALLNFQSRFQSRPDLWIRRHSKTEVDKVKEQLGRLTNADPRDIVMVSSSTSGINAIFKSQEYRPGDIILHFHTIYGPVKKLLQFIYDKSNRTVSTLQFYVNYPMSDDQLVERLKRFIEGHVKKGDRIVMALIDHITAKPHVINPVEKIIPILRSHGIISVIDGANAIGQVNININGLKPDYYVTSCHKWLFCSTGCAMLYIDPKWQGQIHPNNIAWQYSVPAKFQEEFYRAGSRDYSPYLTVKAALEFREWVGGEETIRNYTHILAVAGGKYLAERLGTHHLVLENEAQTGSAIDVRLPLNKPEDPRLTKDFWIDAQLNRFDVFASVYKFSNHWFVRASAQIYNDLDDFEEAAKMFKILCDEVNSNKYITEK